jgi:periplasmic protein TonB
MGLPDPFDKREFLTPSLNDQPIWSGLYENIRDRFFPPKLPPLQLTSRPIPVPDRMATSTNPWAVGSATLVNGGILAMVLLLGLRAVTHQPPTIGSIDKFDLKDFPLFAPAKGDSAHGGGGGGDNSIIDASKGRNPKLDMNPIAPVQMPVLDHPKLPIDNSVAVPPEIKLPDNAPMPMIGVHNSANVTLVSGGQGGPVGIGTGQHGGDGPGDGPGAGPGRDGGFGGKVYTAGTGGVSQPVPIFTPDAEFSDEARRQKYQGVCEISVIIDAQGNPQSPRVVQRLGMGLDEKALQAVMRYRFKPAKKDGKPVSARMTVVVNFRLY